MFSDVLRGIVGVDVFPVVSLVTFVVVFAAVLIWAARADRARLDACAALPLTDSDDGAGQIGHTGDRRAP